MARAKKKKERRVHIDNLHLAKKLDPEYAKLFFDLEDTLLHSGMSDEEILDASEIFPLPDGTYLIVEG